ncbi:MAG: SusC/RagA family TonB-linked outer membrane protein [Mediterranea sp.]|jgi:TonB-linked SusC/RagA family outer membrane protein|nr:SusC/RagA family TonB-linked outer membrane protein [Mediterranea sp.]
MKQLRFLSFFCCLWALAVQASPGDDEYGKTTSFTFEFRDVTMQEVMHYIEAHSDFVFLYSGIETSSRVSIKVERQTIYEVLSKLLGNRDHYEVAGKQIILKQPAPPKANSAQQQQKPQSVQGVVMDELGEPVIGASVAVTGTKTGGITDINGRFRIDNLPATATEITVSYLGYVAQTLKITAGQMTVNLKPDSQQLNEVVVTGMYQMDKRLSTGATTQIKASDMKLDGVADISRSLEGRVAGVSVQNVTGTFGTAPRIKIRGATSIYGDSKPLWVVDGVIMQDVADVDDDALSSGDAETMISSAIAGLNASDIESFQILKDGSATSIYGAKAMAGVIVVTTKKGASGKARVNYTGEFTVRLIPSYSEFNIMNSQDQMGIYRELEEKGWLNMANIYNAKNSGVYGKMYQLMNQYDETSGTYGLKNTQAARNAYLRTAEMRDTNWFSKLFSMALQQNHSVSISGGSENTRYYGSISALYDPGWYKDSNVKRYTANLNLEHDISKKLTISMKANTSYRQQKAPGTVAQDIDNLTGAVTRSFDINPYSYSLNTSRTLSPDEYYTRNYAPFNIMHELDNNYLEFNVADFLLQGELRYKPIPNLTFSALGAIKYTGASYEHNIKDESNQAEAYRAMGDKYIRNANKLLYSDPDHPYDSPISILPDGGIYERTDNRLNGYNARFSADYNWTPPSGEHIVKAYAGMEVTSTDRYKNWSRAWGREYDMGDISKYAWQAFKQSAEMGDDGDYYSVDNTRERDAAFFATANYSYKAKYNITLTGRYEGTNRLGKSRSARWLPTWNVGGSWNIHEESWFKKVESVLSHATVRASYSLTGDRGPSSVSNSLPIVRGEVSWRPVTDYQESALYIDNLGNSELTYEKKHELNMGVDLGFLDNRINLNADVYFRNNYDLIGRTTAMGLGGFVSKMANVASMKGSGVDLTLSTTNIRGKRFSWSTDFIYSYARTKITELDAREIALDMIKGLGGRRVGYAQRALFSIPYAGLDSEGIPMFYDRDGKKIYKVDFQENADLANLKYEGPTTPTMTGSFGNSFRWENFRINLFITYSFGNKVRLDNAVSYSYNDLDATPKELKNRWMVPGDEKKTGILPAIISYRQYKGNGDVVYAYQAYNYSDQRVADGGFIRMKEISAMYTFPRKWQQAIGLSNLSLKLQGTNLFLIYADKKLNGQDPEFIRSGGVSSPMARQFTATLTVGL